MSRISGHPFVYDPIFLEDDSPNSDYDADPLDDDSDNSDCDAVPLDDDSDNSDSDAVPLDDDSVNSDCDAVPLDVDSVKSDCDAVPLDVDSVKSDCDAVPLDVDSVKSDCDAVPLDDDSVNSDCDAVPLDDDSDNSDSDAVPLDDDSVNSDCDAVPLDVDSVKSDCDAVPLDVDSVKSDCDAVPLDDDSVNSDCDAAPLDDDSTKLASPDSDTNPKNTRTSDYESDPLNTLKDASTNSEFSDLFMDDSPNADHGSDPLDDSDAKLDVVIDEDEEEFESLRNCHIAGNSIALSLEDFTHKVQYTTCKQREFQESFPGVQASSFYELSNPKSVLVGFLKIDPRTVKPFERTQNLKIIYTVLSGKIVVKSTEIEEVNGLITFQKKEIRQGSCIEIPAKHPYTLENRTDKEVVLQYVVLELPHKSS